MKLRRLLFLLLYANSFSAQEERPYLTPEKPLYNRKEEILYENKRYRVHNNYLTIGPGFLRSTSHTDVQQALAADFQFHIRRQHFQIGSFMSGQQFFSNNYVQAHVCYGYRREGLRSNFAFFGGLMYFSGVEGDVGSPPTFFDGFGVHVCGQAVYKLLYDIGIGAEVFADLSYKQASAGIKLIAYFSGAYRGPKKKYNPNVRSQTTK